MASSFLKNATKDDRDSFFKNAAAIFAAAATLAVEIIPFANVPTALISFIAALFLSDLCLFSDNKENKRISVKFIVYIILFLICVIFFRQFIKGFSAFANSVIELWNARFDTQFSMINGADASFTNSVVFFGLMLSAVMVAFETAIVGKKYYIVEIVLFLSGEFLMFMTVYQGMWGLTAMIAFIAIFVSINGAFKGKNITNMFSTGITVVAITLVAYILLTDFHGSYQIAQFKENIVNGVHKLRYGDDILPDGDMTRVADMYSDDDVRLTVKKQHVTEESLYLYGFIGTEYDGYSKWLSKNIETSSDEWSGIFKWLSSQGFFAQRMYAQTLSKADKDNISRAEVINVNADRSKIYVPFTLTDIMDDGYKYNNDLNVAGTGIIGRRSYEFEYAAMVDSEDVLITRGSAVADAAAYDEALNVYNTYANTVYTSIDDDTKTLMNEVFFDSEYFSADTGLYSVISRIRAVLELRHPYNSDADDYTGERGFAQWFLESGRAGNSPYFAAIGTLALRAAGYPARYAEGYYVQDGGGDGDFIDITSQDGHAWSEVYLTGIGWVPVEFTPGYYTQILLNEMTVEISSDNAPGGGSESNDYHMSEKYEGKNSLPEETDENEVDSEKFVLNVIVVLGLIVLLLVGLVVRREVFKLLTKNQLKSEKCAACLYGMIFKVITLTLGECDRTRPLDYTDKVVKSFNGIRKEEYERMIFIMQKSIFGDRPLSKLEKHSLLSFYAKVKGMIYNDSGIIKRFKLLYIDLVC